MSDDSLIEVTPNSSKVLNGWSETEIGEVPEFTIDQIYSSNPDAPEFQNIYINLLYLKNLWVNRPKANILSVEEILILQKKIEVATLAEILIILGFNVPGPLDLDTLVSELASFYPDEEFRTIQTAPRGANPMSFASSLENAQAREIFRFRDSEQPETLVENKLVEGKKIIFLNSLMSKGIGYGFVHFINILRNLNKATSEDLNKALNNNFGFVSAKVENRIYFAEISDHIANQIVQYAKSDLKNNADFVILISDDIIDAGGSIDAVIRSIIARLKENELSQELVDACVERIVIDSSNCYMGGCKVQENSYLWQLKEHPDYGIATYKIEIRK